MNTAQIEYASDNGKTFVRVRVTTYAKLDAERSLRAAVRKTGRRITDVTCLPEVAQGHDSKEVVGYSARGTFKIPFAMHVAAISAVLVHFTEDERFRCVVEEKEALCSAAMITRRPQ